MGSESNWTLYLLFLLLLKPLVCMCVCQCDSERDGEQVLVCLIALVCGLFFIDVSSYFSNLP